MEQIKIGGFDAHRVPRTCGLDFREYSLEILLDDKTQVTIGVYPDLTIDGLKLAERLDFKQILTTMKTRKNIY